jgi:hypothetical protein
MSLLKKLIMTDPNIVQSALDFFWHTGFSIARSPLAVNWKNSVLVDGSEIANPRSYGWEIRGYGKRDPKSVLRK